MDVDEAKSFFEGKESSLIDKVCSMLRGHEDEIMNYMADMVAATCGISKDVMLKDCDKIYIAQARWLYWYAIRYMTNDTYEKIAERTALQGHRYASSSIGLCINKMSQLIETNPLWKYRWGVIKSIAKVWMDGEAVSSHKKQEIKITVHSPREYNLKFDIKKD